MKKICVITGGGSGMGLATAKILGKEGNYIILVGRTKNKLESAILELSKEGIQAEAFSCDASDVNSVNKLASYAKSLGNITTVIHAAGISPSMGDGKTIMQINALGTINIHNAFFNVMEEGSCLIDVASMSGYMMPTETMPTENYKYSLTDADLFIKKMNETVAMSPQETQPWMAYAISKNFIIWLVQADANRFGTKGIRLISVSPGVIETPMSSLEDEKVTNGMLQSCAIKRVGKAEEVANLLAFCASNKASYLTGIDIICDGGFIANLRTNI